MSRTRYTPIKFGEYKCHTCDFWVCTDEHNLKGFCVIEDLYTYTNRVNCRSYIEGEYMLLGEFENSLYKKTESVKHGEIQCEKKQEQTKE